MKHLPKRGLVLLTLPMLALAGCGDSGAADGSNVVNVQITDKGCEPGALTLDSGPTTFKVKNTGTSKVTEYEVLQGSRIIGEVENIASGFERSFSLNLAPGSYGLKCPGGSSQTDGVLTVKGTATTLAADAAGVVANYRTYVQTQSDELVTRTQAFTDAVIAGDIAKAKSLYPAARVPYERIEPVAESFGDLDPSIDGRADDVPVEQITGYHRLEEALWVKNSTAGMEPIAKQLLADVTTLRDRVKTLDIQEAQISNGATELLGEVTASKVTGEEERYSHTDLWDFAGNVDGSKAAIDAVRPLLDKADPELGKTIDARFKAVDDALAPFRRGNGFAYYGELTKDDTRKLSQAIDALAEPVSQVSAKVVIR